MANALNLITQTPSLRSCTIKTARSIPSSPQFAPLKPHAIRKNGAKHSIFINRKITTLKPYHVFASFDTPHEPSFEDAASDLPLEGTHELENKNPVSKTIMEFYDCVNGNNVERISELVSEDCCFDDYSFPHKFEGKKEVCNFFYKLSKSMGENVKFCIEDISQGGGHTACAIWHLEWKEERIPFTRGCSFFRCFIEGDKLVIREARVLIESPAKPGVVVVAVLDLVRSVFDDFPDFTRWFLKSPQVLLQTLVNIYNIVAAPFINPLLMFYTQIGMLVYKWFSYMIGFLRYIAKLLK